MTIRNRITGSGTADPTHLLANPANWRIHPEHQQRALEGALREIGWTEGVLVNEQTGQVVDGHLRVELALRRGEQAIPVTYVDLTVEEERLVLATLDPMASYATTDEDAARALLTEIRAGDADLQQYLAQQASELGLDAGDTEALSQPFAITPTTVLDARQGEWLQRKRAWIALGIRSETGRDKELTFGLGCQSGATYDLKKKREREDGTQYSWERFAELYPDDVPLSTTSIFDPVLCETAYRWFCPEGGSVLDPFAGGSVRGVVAAMLGHQYTGIELRGEQVEANRHNWDEIKSSNQGAVAATAPPDYTPELTPVEEYGETHAKRDDLYAFAGSRGGKVRTCQALATGATGLVTAGARHSPQVNIVAGIAQAQGIPCHAHVPSGALTPELIEAQRAGAEVVQHTPGRNSVIRKRARDDARETGYTEIPFGMECWEAVTQTRMQTANVPTEAQRIVVPVGSGMTLAGILHGLRDNGLDTPVLGVTVGADPTERLDKYAPEGWREQALLVPSGTPYEQPRHETWAGITLDPHYEGKAAPHVKDGDLFWIVGRRKTEEPGAAIPDPQWGQGDGKDVATLAPGKHDLIFSCPPYADLEVYSQEPGDISAMEYPEFMASYREIIAGAAEHLQNDRYAVWVVSEVRDKQGIYRDFVGDTVRAFERAGMRLVTDAILVTSTGSLAMRAGRFFQASRKLGRAHQNVLVFAKGNPEEKVER